TFNQDNAGSNPVTATKIKMENETESVDRGHRVSRNIKDNFDIFYCVICNEMLDEFNFKDAKAEEWSKSLREFFRKHGTAI
ncbi:MAG TPA: hypothetical protein VEF04_19245, partial [Blastocatellia bacterium]|nr:hypothetical protein [Blastocatellia bacterium]